MPPLLYFTKATCKDEVWKAFFASVLIDFIISQMAYLKRQKGAKHTRQ